MTELLPRWIYWCFSIILVISIMVIRMAMHSIPGLPTDVFCNLFTSLTRAAVSSSPHLGKGILICLKFGNCGEVD